MPAVINTIPSIVIRILCTDDLINALILSLLTPNVRGVAPNATSYPKVTLERGAGRHLTTPDAPEFGGSSSN